MRILVLTFYFEPDLSAGAFRATTLVSALRDALPADSHIDVLTSQPNRYHTYSAPAAAEEQRGNIGIRRIPVSSHRSGMLDQSRAFVHFTREVRRAVQGLRYDIVVATSSRLMTAALGAWVARATGARLYLDIRDIFVDTIKDVMRAPAALLAVPLFARVERWTVAQAATVNLVSRGFASYFESRYPTQRFTYHPNGIDAEFIETASASAARGEQRSPLTVLYAGNIGEGQGLHAILPPLARRMQGRVHFRVVGDGGRRTALEQILRSDGVTNVEVVPPVQRQELQRLYRESDVLFLHLNDYEAFTRVLPSKIFEYAAVGKPLWAGVAGFAASFIESEVENAAVFRPGDVDDAVRAFEALSIGDILRSQFVERYARTRINREMARDIISLASG